MVGGRHDNALLLEHISISFTSENGALYYGLEPAYLGQEQCFLRGIRYTPAAGGVIKAGDLLEQQNRKGSSREKGGEKMEREKEWSSCSPTALVGLGMKSAASVFQVGGNS